ncbi:MAG: tRNA (cytidine(34)-2'-O)-methyltransferase [Hyphomicrobiaceae bacterium]
MRLALYQPDIPQNTGTILRMAACFGVPVDIIGPAGFDMRDSALRRAGLDYLDRVDLVRHISFPRFLETCSTSRLVLLTTRGDISHTDFRFLPSDRLLLGRESAGVPDDVHARAAARVVIPIRPGLRSLNIAVAAAIALGEALRQTGGLPPQDTVDEQGTAFPDA